MRRVHWSGFLAVAVAVLALCTVGEVLAQGRPGGQRGGRGGFQPGRGFGGPGGGTSLVALALNQEVQKELEMVEDQVAQVRQLAESLRGGRPGPGGGDRPDFRNMTEEQRRQFFEQMRQQAEQRRREAEQKLAEILLPHQMDRLKQISIQVRGLQALRDPEVAGQLGITPEQREKMEQIQQESFANIREQMRELFQAGNRDAIRQRMEALRQETEQKVLAVLTEEQRKKFEELKGKPLSQEVLAQLRGGGFGGFGRGGGPGGPGGGRPGGRPQRPGGGGL